MIANNPVLDGNPTITPGSDKRRSVTSLDLFDKTDLVAEYKDGKPLIAIRYDQSALVTSLAFQCGEVGSKDGIKVVINALLLRKV